MNNGIINRLSFSVRITPIRKSLPSELPSVVTANMPPLIQIILKNSLMKFLAAIVGMFFGSPPSRRTPSNIISIIKTYPFEYMLIWSQDAFNPPARFYCTCDHLYLTADSASMISEAVSFGSASVNLLPVHTSTLKVNCTFAQQLCKEGYVNCSE